MNFITSFIASGYLVKIYRGGDVAPELEEYLEMFIDGIKLSIIQFIYLFIPIILITAGVVFTGVGVYVFLSEKAAVEKWEATDRETTIDTNDYFFAAVYVIIGLLLILIGIVPAIILGLIAT